MAVPRARQSNARKNKKRAHLAKKPLALAKCKNCRADKPMHHVCAHCGYYKGRAVLAVS